ncbi:hypothetical protein ACLOJK_000511 [Asimina triloba]
MEDSGAILYQISSFKDMIDQVNEDIEVNIQRTREIESEIVKCSEVEKILLTRESEHIKLIITRELELNDLIQVAGYVFPFVNSCCKYLIGTVEEGIEFFEKQLGGKAEEND